MGDVLPQNLDRTPIRMVEADQVTEEHGLPASAPADDDHRFPELDFEIDPAQNVLRAETLVQAVDFDHGAVSRGRLAGGPGGWGGEFDRHRGFAH
jgi:hypothetical protein